MTVITQITIAVALVLSIILPFGYYLIGEKNRGRYKTALGVNAFFFFGTMLIAIAVMFTGASSVQAAAGSEGTLATGMGYIAIAVILAVFVILVDIALASINFGKAGSAERDLKIVIPESLIYDEVFNDIFSTYTSRHELIRVKTTNMGSLFKLTYQITLRDARKEKEFIDKLRERNGNLEITCARPGNGNVEI